MNIKRFYFIVSMLVMLVPAVNAEDTGLEKKIGVITDVQSQKGEIYINDSKYKLYPDVKVHPREENKEMNVFDLEKNMLIQYTHNRDSISEIWISNSGTPGELR